MTPQQPPLIMGIVNVTPDSFSDGGLFLDAAAAIEHGLRLASDGADILDVGGESTRPGSEPVSVEEELNRVIPVIASLASSGHVVSIDTTKPKVAEVALEAGATLINDISGMTHPDMIGAALRHGATVCAMHMKGTPKTMQARPEYSDVVREVLKFLMDRVDALTTRGLPRDKIWIDPGIGFGKTLEHNVALLRALPKFVATGAPVMIGVSRKSFLGSLIGSVEAPASVEDREEGTLAVHVLAQLAGVRALRTHNVVSAVRARQVVEAIGAEYPRASGANDS